MVEQNDEGNVILLLLGLVYVTVYPVIGLHFELEEVNSLNSTID